MEGGTGLFLLSLGALDMGLSEEELPDLIDDWRMYLKIVNKRLEMDVVPGDTVQGGVIISNSEVGLGAVSVQPLLYRLVCTNGMVVNDLGERRTHVGRAAKAVEDSFTLYSDEALMAEEELLNDSIEMW